MQPTVYECPICGSLEVIEVTATDDPVPTGICMDQHTAPLKRAGRNAGLVKPKDVD